MTKKEMNKNRSKKKDNWRKRKILTDSSDEEKMTIKNNPRKKRLIDQPIANCLNKKL